MPDRFLGGAPIAIFLAHLRYNRATGRAVNSLWICHIILLLLGFGLFFRKRWAMGIASIWSVIGLSGWVFDMIQTGERSVTSFLSHVGGLGMSLFAVRRTGMEREDWARASLFFLALQEACRRFVSPDLNVNAAFEVRPEMRWLFSRYSSYWMAGMMAMATITYGINRVLIRAFGEPPEGSR